jgi:hypothetical protein
MSILNILRPAPAERTFSLTRHFVLTGDERCPIAGIWSCLESTPLPASQPTDDPSLTRPAVGELLWRAVHRPFISMNYLPA